MPELDQQFVLQAPGPSDQDVIEGTLAKINGKFWARVDQQGPLWGPLKGGDDTLIGQKVAIGISQKGTLYVIWPNVSGGAGPPGTGDANYVFTQGTPSAVWTVAHGLNKYPAVDVVDTGGTVVIPSVAYIDANNLRITFGSATTGKAFMN